MIGNFLDRDKVAKLKEFTKIIVEGIWHVVKNAFEFQFQG